MYDVVRVEDRLAEMEEAGEHLGKLQKSGPGTRARCQATIGWSRKRQEVSTVQQSLASIVTLTLPDKLEQRR